MQERVPLKKNRYRKTKAQERQALKAIIEEDCSKECDENLEEYDETPFNEARNAWNLGKVVGLSTKDDESVIEAWWERLEGTKMRLM